MSDSQIETRVLSEAFQEAMEGWRLRSAVFLTFRFDPGFFEQEVLPVFFDIPMSHSPGARVLHLADALRGTGPVAVYYDRRGVESGSAPARTDFERIGVTHSTGYFHPKNVFLLVESTAPESEWEGRKRPTRLIVASMSANLTRAGWWENVEVAHIDTAEENLFCGFRDDLLALCALLRRNSPAGASHSALEEIHSFVRRCEQDPQRLYHGLLVPRLYIGGQNVPEFLEANVGARIRDRFLEVISPYFDKSQSLKPISELIKRFRPRETRVFLPKGATGEALCSESFWTSMKDLGVSWAILPNQVVRMSRDTSRFVHAKIYRFFDPADRRQTFFIGSVNLTNAGFDNGGNVETGFLVEVEGKRKSDWWLDVHVQKPKAFIGKTEDDGLEAGPGTNLVLRFDWRTGRLSAIWDDDTQSPPLTLLASGVHLGDIGPLEPHVIVSVEKSIAIRIQEHLVSSSFITVQIEGQNDAIILVDELSSVDKPSLLATITPEEILRYWSLLTDAQKQEFLETHAYELDGADAALWIGSASVASNPKDGIFGTFAHVFLSFGNLERAVRNALSERKYKEAMDRLFGRKFDSVRRLVEKIAEKEQQDPVRDYITLLCAIQLLEAIKKDEPEFYSIERERFQLLDLARSTLSTTKTAFSFGTESERALFFDWFDRWFLRRATPESPVQSA